jgi:hypothetical protein
MEWLLAALVGGFLTFNAVVTPDKAAQMAESALQKKYPDATVKVDIKGKKGKAVLNGKFKTVRLEMTNLVIDDFAFGSSEAVDSSQPKSVGEIEQFSATLHDVTWEGMAIEQIDFSFQDLRYDLEALKKNSNLSFVSFGPANLKVRIGAKALAPVFAEKMSGVQNLAVTINGGAISATGKRQVMGFTTPFQYSAKLAYTQNQLLFENHKLLVSGVPVPEMLAKSIIGEINPVYTFDKSGKWPFIPSITKVVADKNLLVLEASLTQKNRDAGKLDLPSRAN